MKKPIILLVCLMSTIFVDSLFGIIIEYPLGEPPEYIRRIGPAEVNSASVVDIYVENILEPLRWKEWYIEIWTVESAGIDQLFMDVDYHLQPDRNDVPTWILDISLAQIQGDPIWGTAPPGYEGFYADTQETPWEDYDTTPVGSGQGYDLGNPAWISWHFDDLPDCSIYYICDKCIPEPATICLLGFAGFALIRRKHL